MPTSDQVYEYLQAVDALLAEDGCGVSDEFRKVRVGWEAVRAGSDQQAAEQAIIDAAVLGDEQGVRDALGAYKLTTINPQTSWREHVARACRGALKRAYAETAEANFEAIKTRFDRAASELHKAAAVVDLATPPESIIGKSRAERQAWMDATEVAKQLDDLLVVLTAAASLAGVDTKPPGARLALVVDAGSAHRRRVWEAWESPHRWAALARVEGVTITAAELAGFEPLAEPRLMQTVQVKGGMGVRMVQVDPEDADFAEQVAALKGKADPAAAADERRAKALGQALQDHADRQASKAG